MSKHRHGGRNNRSRGGSAGGGGNRHGKISYDAGDEPAFIRQFKERTGYKPPATAEDKVEKSNYLIRFERFCIIFIIVQHRKGVEEYEERRRDGDYRLDDERPQIVQLDATDLTKEEVDVEIAKAKEGTNAMI